MARTFVTSDTHFGHENIIRYANRPFANWRMMGEAMIERWNSRVAADDVVYFLGDFAMGPGAKDDYVEQVLRRLNGDKIGVLGNHDQPSKWSVGLKQFVLEKGIDNFRILTDQIHAAKIDGVDFLMCHYPMVDWDGKFHGTVHLHGHAHTQYRSKEVHNMVQSRRYDIGVDMFGGPVQVTGDLRFLNNPKGWE